MRSIAEALGRGPAQHRDRLALGGGVQVAALDDADPERFQQAEARRLDVQRIRVQGRDERSAEDVAGDAGGLGDAGDGVDPPDHRGRRERQLRGLSREALSVGDGEQIRAELVDLAQKPSLTGGGQAEHRDDRGHADGDPERGQPGAQPPRAQPHARNAGEIRRTQPRWREVHDAEPGSGARSVLSATAAVRNSGTFMPGSLRVPAGARFRGCRRSRRCARRASRTWRGSCAASARSWVITRIVEPSRVELLQESENRRAGGAVEVAGGLVSQHDRRSTDERPRDRDPLALTAGELAGAKMQARSASPTRASVSAARRRRADAPTPA